MILITCACVIGEREHHTHHYAKNYTSKDYYDSDTLYDSLIKEMWELTDDDYNAEEDEWWKGDDIVYIYDVRDMSPSEFKTLKEMGILYE
jgi:hypothetical protein